MRQGGYTLVSVSLALVVASIMTLAFFSGASNDTRIEMLSRTNLVVKRLHNSVSMYYDKQCQTGAVPNPTINDLVNSGSLKDSSSVAFTKGATLDSITIEYNGAPPAIFRYKVKFLSQGDAEIAAGNRLTDAAAVYQMPAPLRDRFSHYELDVNYEDWCNWAASRRLDPTVISFIQYRTNLLYSFSADEYAFPTPRSWHFVSNISSKLSDNMDTSDVFSAVASLVGDGAAGEFVAFKEVADSLPDIDQLIEKPETYKKDDNPAILYALTGAVAARACDDKMENIMKVNKKLPVEFQVILVKGALAVEQDLRKNPEVKKWILDNANVIL